MAFTNLSAIINKAMERFATKKLLAALPFLAVTLTMIPAAEAAMLFITPAEKGDLSIGQTFEMNVQINTEGQAFNAAQATINFPKNILEVASLNYSPAATIFNFWLEEPQFSNSDGAISFVGGATNGVSGVSVPVLTITFRTKGSGGGDIVASDAAITAADGNGTNILSIIQIGRVSVNTTVVAPPPAVTKTAPAAPVAVAKADASKPKTSPVATASENAEKQKNEPLPKLAQKTADSGQNPDNAKKDGAPLAAGASGVTQFWLIFGASVLILASFMAGRLSFRLR